MNRPTGVTIIAALVIINGILLIIGALVAGSIVVVSALTPIFASGTGTVIRAGLGVAGIFILLDGILHLFVGGGLLSLRNWAWWVAVIISGLTVLGSIFELVARGRINGLSTIISVIIFVYLLLPDIRAHFAREREIPAG
jgi:hypothetical protein